MDSPTAALLDHEKIYQTAAADPRHTSITLPPVDINKVLAEMYEPVGEKGQPLRMTREQLWDMECRKAKDPAKYLGPIIRPGTAKTFPSTRHGRFEDFVRVAEHRPWKSPGEWHMVIENIRMDHDSQTVWFVGTKEFHPPKDGTGGSEGVAAGKGASGATGKKIVADGASTLFHVLHGVEGTEEEPINTWGITLLTEERDLSLSEHFVKLGQDPYLRPFVEVYIREVMGVDLKRK